MRYFAFDIKLKREDIKSTKVNFREYSYDNPIEGLTSYIFKTLANGNSFVIYREEDSGLKAMFAINEKIRQPKEAFEEIIALIADALETKVKTSDMYEITMLDFDANLSESKRRGLSQYWSRIADQASILLYEDRESILTGRCGFKLDEAVAENSTKKGDEDHLFDESLKEEIQDIRSGAKKRTAKGLKAIPCHYIISARSKEAGSDIALKLMQTLAQAGRLSSGRMELFTEIDEELYRRPGMFERVIENSNGGTIVIDLTERFGRDPSNYGLTCDYLAKTIRKYRNNHLFVFLYDMDNPGFTFYLMPKIEKSLCLVKIREGKGDAEAAENYLKLLIKSSDFAVFSSQAKEFLETIPQSEYTQTDILKAYDSFESWCMRKNILKSDKVTGDEGFFLERDDNNCSAYEKLQSMIGLNAVKEQIDKIILANKAEKQREKYGSNARAMHMIFSGNPGTGKTEVAELVAKICKEKGILKSGAFVQRAGMDLSGFFAPFKIRQAFEQAKGGVLFIDEAYSFGGDCAVAALIREMESRRKEVIVIFGGYKERMKEFLEQNEGLASRIPYTVDFPDYNAGELLQIYDYILKQDGFIATPGAREEAREIFEKACRIENFGNGRYARNLAEKSTLNMSVRLARKYGDEEIPKDKLFKVTKEDVYIPDDPIVNCNNGEKRKGKKEPEKSGKELLESMIGLESAKAVVEGAVATFKMQKRLRKSGIDIGRNTMHMVFSGNPGTAKTTIARLVAQILKEEGVLSTGAFVEAGRADLIAGYEGQTALRVRKKFSDAMGGVLFIDEAYSLDDGNSHGYGDEAINTIVQEMDNRREDMIVIFAGYPDEMNSFIERNPGMSSRIAIRVNFDDYSTEELCAITRFQVAQRHLNITDEAVEKLAPIYDAARQNKTFGNGRYVRRAVELAISNLAVRLYRMNDKDITKEILTTITAEDIEEPLLDETAKPKRRIGFAA